MTRVVILISGRGSNMQAMVEAALPGVDVVAVLSNRPDAAGLAWAAQRGIATAALDHKQFASREAFDAQLADLIDGYAPDLVVLAGYMRILTADFVRRYEGRMMNIHPSLLPAYPGLNTHQRALDDGLKIAGCTVHFVTAELDHGPIVAQAAVPVLDSDDAASLSARVLAQEHQIYSQAVAWFAAGRLQLENGKVRLRDAQASDSSALRVPQS